LVGQGHPPDTAEQTSPLGGEIQRGVDPGLARRALLAVPLVLEEEEVVGVDLAVGVEVGFGELELVAGHVVRPGAVAGNAEAFKASLAGPEPTSSHSPVLELPPQGSAHPNRYNDPTAAVESDLLFTS